MFRHLARFQLLQLFRRPTSGGSVPPVLDVANLLLETGDDILFETGGLILLE